MTRICAGCRKVLGEKCRNCGAPALPVPSGLYVCSDVSCRAAYVPSGFPAGDGGITHGLCPECVAKQRGEVSV